MTTELTGTDLIRASTVVSGYTAHFKQYMTERRVNELTDLAIKLNNNGIRRSD
jgi:hypothetical protein